MNPLQTKIQTSAGMETPQETLARARAITTPTTGTFSVKVPNAVPSTALSQGSTIADVRNTRNQMEQSQLQQTQLGTDYNTLQSSINAPLQGTPISNPDAYINQLLLSRPTETQNQLDQAGQNQANAAQGFANDYTKTVNTANEQFGVPQLQANLAETRKQIADRTVQLRNDLRQFEVNAKDRGVARAYVDDAKQKVQADAAAQLADLSIIENAQVGNITQANSEIDRLLQNKRTAYELQNNAMEAEIKRLTAMDTREGDQRAKQLTVALQERKQNIETQLANEKETRQYMMEAAANGADHGTLAAIQNAKTPGEALLAAGSWVGRLDRQLKIAQTNSANRANQPSAGGNNQMTDNERALMTQFRGEQIVKDYNEIASQKGTIDSYINGGVGGPADLALVFSFMKGLDPNSVVRESEYQTAAQSGNIFQGAFAKYNGYLKENGGFLPDNVKTQFQNLVDQKLAVKEKQYKNVVNNYNDIATRQGLNPKNVVIDYASGTASKYKPGDTVHDNGILYQVEADGQTVTPIGSYAGN